MKSVRVVQTTTSETKCQNVLVKFTHTLSSHELRYSLVPTYTSLPVWAPLTKGKIIQRKFVSECSSKPNFLNIAVNYFSAQKPARFN